MASVSRRTLLRRSFLTLGVLTAGATVALVMRGGKKPSQPETPGGARSAASHDFPAYRPAVIDPPKKSNIARVGPLGDPDALGLRLPVGFTARVVARSGQPVEGTGFTWHAAPDGGAVFLAEDGGYAYVSNCELPRDAGASALRFDANGKLLDAYRILSGTNVNCAGGATPWGTWLSCEEHATGMVWECDPFGKVAAAVRPALGVFDHEAVAVDPVKHQLYLTEDLEDGCLYRFTPSALVNGRPDLASGKLHVMGVPSGGEGLVSWIEVHEPQAYPKPTRYQVAHCMHFNGGEGIAWHDGVVYFGTKGDNRVWAYDTTREDLTIVYDGAGADTPILDGLDNITITPAGDIVVAEDGGDMQLIAITQDRKLVPLVQVTGHPGSEISGPALDPYRRRLYFSSQRGESGEPFGRDGITYEISGPFFV